MKGKKKWTTTKKKTNQSPKSGFTFSLFGSPVLTNVLLFLFCVLLFCNLMMEVWDVFTNRSSTLLSAMDSSLPPSHHQSRRRRQVAIFASEFGTYPNLTWIDGNDKPSVTLLSAALYARRDRKEPGDMNHRTYANIHGYQFDLLTKSKYLISKHKKRTEKHYQKTAHIYQHIVDALERKQRRRGDSSSSEDEPVDLLMWIDNDALFMDCDQTVENLYRQSHEFYAREFARETESDQFRDMVVTGDRGASINSGVIIIRPSEWTKRVFSDWYAYSTSWAIYKKETKAVCFDQPILHAVLNGLQPEELLLNHGEQHSGSDNHHSNHTSDGSIHIETDEEKERFRVACSNWTNLSVREKMEVLDSKRNMGAQWNRVWNQRSRPFDRPGCSSEQAKYAWRNLLTKESRDHTLIIPQRWLNSDWKYRNSKCNWKPGDYVLHFHGVPNRWGLLAKMNKNSTCF